MPPSSMQAALETKRVDAAASYEPVLSGATRGGARGCSPNPTTRSDSASSRALGSKPSPDTLRSTVKLYTPPTLNASSIQPVVDAAAKAHEIPAPFPAADLVQPGVP